MIPQGTTEKKITTFSIKLKSTFKESRISINDLQTRLGFYQSIFLCLEVSFPSFDSNY